MTHVLNDLSLDWNEVWSLNRVLNRITDDLYYGERTYLEIVDDRHKADFFDSVGGFLTDGGISDRFPSLKAIARHLEDVRVSGWYNYLDECYYRGIDY